MNKSLNILIVLGFAVLLYFLFRNRKKSDTEKKDEKKDDADTPIYEYYTQKRATPGRVTGPAVIAKPAGGGAA